MEDFHNASDCKGLTIILGGEEKKGNFLGVILLLVGI